MKLFDVNLMANVTTWRGIDYQTVRLFVYATCLPDAMAMIENQKELIYEWFDKKRNGKRRLVGFPIKKNLFFDRFGAINEYRNLEYNVTALTDDGFKRVTNEMW